MKIGFVAEPYEESNASGMGYVVLEFIKNLVEQGTGEEFVVYSSKPVSRELLPGKFTNVITPKGFVKKFFYFLRLKDNVDTLLFIAPLLPLSHCLSPPSPRRACPSCTAKCCRS